MPICPNCGAHLEDGIKTCQCGTPVESDYDRLLRKEAEKVEVFNDYKSKSMDSFEDGEYEKTLEYADKLKELDLGMDASVLFVCGKSNFYLKRFYDALICFLEYLEEFEDTFYRFADISGAYEWKAACLWELGFGFEAIKNYYKAFESVDKQPCSIEEKMEMRTRIEESKLKVINASREVGIQNPRLGNMDLEVFDWIYDHYDPARIMQNLYDAIDEVESEGCKFKSLKMCDGKVYVVFDNGLEKYFDGCPTFKD